MNKQMGFEFEQASISERINTLSEEQKETIGAALEVVFSAALFLNEETQDDQ